MVLQTLYSTKKVFYYNFFPTKAEEDFLKDRKGPVDGILMFHSRQLLEMRDIYPSPVVDLDNPWVIKKTLTYYEVFFGKLVLLCNDLLDHELRYWHLGVANHIVVGHRVGVTVWDVTVDKNPKKYQNNGVYLQMLVNSDCVISCLELIKDRDLKVNDEIYLYWDTKEICFKFKVV